VITRIVVVAFCWLAASGVASAATGAVLFRLFLADGTSIVSYGEFARVDDRVIFSMVMGGSAEPRLHAATLPASAVDWARTDRHAASTRYQWYAETRGEDDFLRLSDDVAAVLNQVLLTGDRAQALEVALRARATLAEWPREHYGYRQRDVREILAFLDEAISDLRVATGTTAFEVALVADTPDIILEPLESMPSLLEQIDQAFRVAELSERSSERMALFQTALLLLDEAGTSIRPVEAERLRHFASSRIREEQDIDKRYGDWSRRLMNADSNVPSGGYQGLSGVESHPGPHGDAFRPSMRGQSALSADPRSDPVPCTRKCREESISLRVDYLPAMLLDGVAQEAPVAFQQRCVVVPKGAEEARGSLEVDEEEGDCTCREIAHDANPRALRVPPCSMTAWGASCTEGGSLRGLKSERHPLSCEQLLDRL